MNVVFKQVSLSIIVSLALIFGMSINAYANGCTTPPDLTVSVSPNNLWPPNHRYVSVTATAIVSAACGPVTVALISVTSNEPDNGLGDGDTPMDIVIVDDSNFQLRSERGGAGSGRIYTITYSATDASGNQTNRSASVVVPLNQAY